MKNTIGKILPLLLALVLCVSALAPNFALAADAKPDTTLPADCVWYGDVNEDNSVDVTDIVMLRGRIIGKITFTDRQTKIGDIDKGGDVDVIDVVMLRADVLNTASLGIKVGYSSYGYVKFGSVTNDPERIEPKTLEAEDAVLSGDYLVINSTTASDGAYVKAASSITMQFTVPDGVKSGEYTVTVVAKSEASGTTSNYILGPDGEMHTLSAGTAWNMHEFNMTLASGEIIYISNGDGNFSVDYLVIHSAESSSSTTSKKPSSSTNPPASATTTTKPATTTPAPTTTTKPVTTTTSDGPAEKGFYVRGTKLYDANGNQFIMRGINMPYVWFSSYNTTAMQAVSERGGNCVRVVLGEGTKYSKTTESKIQGIIKMCEKFKLVCVLEIHDFTGDDTTSCITNKAVNYWLPLKDTLNAHKDTVIVNIANEWMSSNTQSTWESTYKTAIKALRNGGIENVLMVDAPGWGQGASSLYNGGQSVLSADKTGNTMFSIHMYSVAGGNAYAVKRNIDNTLNKNLCLVIGEFGHYQNGNVDWSTIMSHCQAKGVGWLAWSWKGNTGADAVLDISKTWPGTELTDWGNNVFYSTYGIKNTSKKCSVFG